MSHSVHSAHSMIQLPATISLALAAWVYARGWLLVRRHRLVDASVGQLAAFMLGRGLVNEAWQTARGAWNVTYNRGLWFRTPEAYDENGNYRASLYLRPLAIWAIEHALRQRTDGEPAVADPEPTVRDDVEVA